MMMIMMIDAIGMIVLKDRKLCENILKSVIKLTTNVIGNEDDCNDDD